MNPSLKGNIHPCQKIYTPVREYTPLLQNIHPCYRIYTPVTEYTPLSQNIFQSLNTRVKIFQETQYFDYVNRSHYFVQK